MSGRDEVMRTNPGVKLTYDDFLLFPDDGKRHELIDGEHYVTPSPSRKHQAIVWNLITMIGPYLTRRRDEIIKHKLYERFGVEEYWVIDPEIETIAVYRRVGEHYQRVLDLAVEGNDTLATSLFPHLTLPLQQIFKD
jgi:Uma2 family endonuclease